MHKKIAFITDIHLDEDFVAGLGVDAYSNWTILLDDIMQKEVDEIIFGGDIGEGSDGVFFFASLKATGIPFSIIIGNHDRYDTVKAFYQHTEDPSSAELFFTKEDETYQYIFLDSSSNSISSLQLTWLEEKLKQSAKKIFLFIHHPVLKVDTEVDRLYPLHNRDEVKQLLTACSKEVTICCGHYHMPDGTASGNIRQFITPAASYQILKDAHGIAVDAGQFGYRLITLDGTEIYTELVMMGKYQDSFFS